MRIEALALVRCSRQADLVFDNADRFEYQTHTRSVRGIRVRYPLLHWRVTCRHEGWVGAAGHLATLSKVGWEVDHPATVPLPLSTARGYATQPASVSG